MTDRREIFKRIRLCMIIVSLTVFGIADGNSLQTVYGDTWSQAGSFYATYGNSAVFRAEDEENGGIFLATCGRIATTTTKFKTIGWRMRAISNGSTIQTLYFSNGGQYLQQLDCESNGGYTYILYSFDLRETKQRLCSSARTALNNGKLNLLLDACMVVEKNGQVGGSMTDEGLFQGEVYTDYSGISQAANWSNEAKASLNSYFNKRVKNLFYTVTLKKGSGISSVTGGGTYCYGTEITISCKVKSGYTFVSWTGTKTYSTKSKTFYVNETMNLTAKGKKKSGGQSDDSGGGGDDSGNNSGGGNSSGGSSGGDDPGGDWNEEEGEEENLYPPVIIAGDRYFTLTEAKNGSVTEAAIRSGIYAYDPDTGSQVPIYIIGLNAGGYRSMSASGKRKVTVYAVDSGGLVSSQEVSIYIFQTDIKTDRAIKGKIRFISQAWYMDPAGNLLGEGEGGLRENSIWRKNPSYASLLNSVIGR